MNSVFTTLKTSQLLLFNSLHKLLGFLHSSGDSFQNGAGLGFVPELFSSSNIFVLFLFLHRLVSLILGSPHSVSSFCLWRPILTDPLLCHPFLHLWRASFAWLLERSATGEKRFAKSRNDLREEKGNSECWLLGKGCVLAAAVENAREAPLSCCSSLQAGLCPRCQGPAL